MVKTKKPKKPTDSTMRNVQAANNRHYKLELRVSMLEQLIITLSDKAIGSGWSDQVKRAIYDARAINSRAK